VISYLSGDGADKVVLDVVHNVVRDVVDGRPSIQLELPRSGVLGGFFDDGRMQSGVLCGRKVLKRTGECE
jgi:hypothetical protein